MARHVHAPIRGAYARGVWASALNNLPYLSLLSSLPPPQALQAAWAGELGAHRAAWEREERSRREAWEADKTREVKELTIRGLEPEIARVVARHREDLRRAEERAREELRRQHETLSAQHEAYNRQLRDRLLKVGGRGGEAPAPARCGGAPLAGLPPPSLPHGHTPHNKGRARFDAAILLVSSCSNSPSSLFSVS